MPNFAPCCGSCPGLWPPEQCQPFWETRTSRLAWVDMRGMEDDVGLPCKSIHNFSPATRHCMTFFSWVLHCKVGCCWDGGGGRTQPPPTLSNGSVSWGAWAQFEALLLEELDVEATAVPEVPEEATDLRMWGMRKGSLASWCTSIRSSLRYTRQRLIKACGGETGG